MRGAWLLSAVVRRIVSQRRGFKRREPDGEISHRRDRPGARSRFFASQNHWGGHCVPLQPIDFKKLDWINYSGWPYTYDELEPYYRRAHAVLGLGAFDYDAPRMGQALGLEQFPFDPFSIETVISRFNPVRFGLTFGAELDTAPNVCVILYAEVTRLVDRHVGRQRIEGECQVLCTGRWRH